MKENLAVLIAVLLLLTGCVSRQTVALKPKSKSVLLNKTLTYVKRVFPTKPFVMTPGKAVMLSLTGMVGGAVAAYSYTSSQEKSAHKVPSYYLNTELIKHLAKKYKMRYVDEGVVTDKMAVDELVKLYESDYILDSTDLRWDVVYFPTHWGTYKVIYLNKIKLIDRKSKKVIAEGFCEYNPEYSDTLPSYDKMFENNASLVKQYTKKALEMCLHKYKTEVFR